MTGDASGQPTATPEEAPVCEIYIKSNCRWIRYYPDDHAEVLLEYLDPDYGECSCYLTVVFPEPLSCEGWKMDQRQRCLSVTYISEPVPSGEDFGWLEELFEELHQSLRRWRWTRGTPWRWTPEGGWEYLTDVILEQTCDAMFWAAPGGQEMMRTRVSRSTWQHEEVML